MTEDLRFDFPVFSDKGPKRPASGEQWQEPIYQLDEGMNWKKKEHGPRVGMMTVSHPKDDTPKTFEVMFEFDNGDKEEYEGNIPGDGSWKGKSRIKRRKGKKKDEIEVESVNPKRWG